MSDGRGLWAKQTREQNKTTVMKHIQEKEPIRYSELKNLVGVSDPTLANYLRELIDQKLITYYEDSKDRRIKWYIIKEKEKVNTQLKKQEAKKLIDSAAHYVTGVEDMLVDDSKVSFHVLVKFAETVQRRAKEQGIENKEIVANLKEAYQKTVEWAAKTLGIKTAKAFKKYRMETGHGMIMVIKVERLLKEE